MTGGNNIKRLLALLTVVVLIFSVNIEAQAEDRDEEMPVIKEIA